MLYSVQETCTRKILYKKPCQTVKFLVQVDLYKFLDCVSAPLAIIISISMMCSVCQRLQYQANYLILVDVRDRPRQLTTYVAEENLNILHRTVVCLSVCLSVTQTIIVFNQWNNVIFLDLIYCSFSMVCWA